MIKIIQTPLIILCFNVCVGQTIFFDSYFKNLKSDTIFSDNKKTTFIKAKNGEDSIKYFNRYFPNGQMAFKQIEITDSEYNMFLYRWRLEYFENGQLKLDSLVDERKNNNILNFTTEYYKNGIKKREEKWTGKKVKGKGIAETFSWGIEWKGSAKVFNENGDLMIKQKTQRFYR